LPRRSTSAKPPGPGSRARTSGFFATAALLTGVIGGLCGVAPYGALAAAGDFNADGFADLAVGSPTEGVEGMPDVDRAGLVTVIYGSSLGLVSAGNQSLVQSGCLPGQPGFRDRLGEAVAVGNFDGDRFEDLAIGVPGEAVGGQGQAGAVDVIYGSSTGLACTRNQVWHEDSPGITGVPEERDNFGLALAGGDFNGDGFDELVIGVPGEGIGDRENAGVVYVLPGSASGLTSAAQLWHQDVAGIAGGAEASDFFGRALVAGSFGNGNAIHEDLAIGAPGEDIGDIVAAGSVSVIYGSPAGLSPADDEIVHQDSESVHGVAEAHDAFGRSLASADFDLQEPPPPFQILHTDLAVGAPGEDTNGEDDAGAVAVLYGGNAGVSGIGDQLFTQDSPLIKGVAEKGDRFGDAVAAANLGKDVTADLAVGVPGEDIASSDDAGGVNVVYGSGAAGLVTADNQFLSAIGDSAASREAAGTAVAAGNFGRGPQADLAVGTIGEHVNGIRSGAVGVLYGGPLLGQGGAEQWHQAKPGIPGSPEEGDFFGFAVTTG
jgi:hypothetical protein